MCPYAVVSATYCAAVSFWHESCVMGQGLGKLVESHRVQLIPRPQQMKATAGGSNLQRQCVTARLVKRRSYCIDKLLVSWKYRLRAMSVPVSCRWL